MASPHSGKHGCGTSLFGLIMIAAWIACMHYGLLWQKNESAKNGYDTANVNTAPAVPLAIDRGRLFLIQPDLRLTALDMATGRVAFRGRGEIDPAVLPPKGPAPELEVFGNLLLVKRDGLLLTALDKRDGKIVIVTRNRLHHEIRGDTLLYYDKLGNLATMDKIAATPQIPTPEALHAVRPGGIKETGEPSADKPEEIVNPNAALMRKDRFVRFDAFELPDNALVRVGSLRQKLRLPPGYDETTVSFHRVVEYADAEYHWEGRINCLGASRFEDSEPAAGQAGPNSRPSPAFVFAADADSLVYSVNAGRVECLDRKTGHSRWLYAFPRSRWNAWNQPAALKARGFGIANWRRGYRTVVPQSSLQTFLGATAATWGKYFYLEDKALNERDLSPDGLLGMSVPIDAAPSRPPLNFDTSPVSFDGGEHTAASVLCRLGALSSLVVLWVLFAGGGTGAAERVGLLVLVLIYDLLVINFFGLYSRDALRWMVLAVHLAYWATALVLMGRHTRP